MNKKSINHLFVYGTLGPNRPNEHILENIGGTFAAGYVFGVLYNEGWGSELGFPGIKLTTEGAKVNGFLFNSENLVNHWIELDEFEGEAYERVLTDVYLKDQTNFKAFIYVLK